MNMKKSMLNANKQNQNLNLKQHTTLKKWWILIAMCLSIVIVVVDISALNVALPTIGRQFDATLSQLQWINNIYIIIASMLCINGGKLGDTFGHRRLFVLGITVFALASFICGISPNEDILILGRALQGLGAALAFPSTNVIIFNSFAEKQRAFAISMISMSSGITQCIAPTVGGFIVKYWGWHWVFFINLPIVALTVILTLIFCPKHVVEPRKQKFDRIGSGILIAGLMLLMCALNEAQNWGFLSFKFIASTMLSIVLFTIFARYEAVCQHPLVNVNLFKNRIFAVASTVRFVISFIWMLAGFLLGLFLQNVLSYDPVKTGLIMLGLSASFALFAPIVGRLVDIYGGRSPIIFALMMLIVSLIVLSCVNPINPLAFVITGIILMGIGFAFSMSPCNTIAIASVPKEFAGMANSIYITISYFGNAFGAAVSGIVIAWHSLNGLQQQLVANNIVLDNNQLENLSQIANGSASITKLTEVFPHDLSLASKFVPLIQKIYLNAFSMVMWLCIVMVVLSLLLVLKTKKRAEVSKY